MRNILEVSVFSVLDEEQKTAKIAVLQFFAKMHKERLSNDTTRLFFKQTEWGLGNKPPRKKTLSFRQEIKPQGNKPPPN